MGRNHRIVMSGRLKRWGFVAGGLAILLLLVISLRPLGFFVHYSAHLFHLRHHHMERARVQLFRAVHFNPVSTLVEGVRKEKVLDAVFFQAARTDDLPGIKAFASRVFPFDDFRDRYAGNPWFQAMMGEGVNAMEWKVTGEIGFRLLSDPGAAAVLTARLGEAAVWLRSSWSIRLAVVARLGENTALAERLDPSSRSRETASRIRKGPERGVPLSGKDTLPGESFNLPMDSSRWNVEIRRKVRNGLAGFVQAGETPALLMAGTGENRRSVVVAVPRMDEMPIARRFRLQVDYLTELEQGALVFRAGERIRWTLPSTRGKWRRASITCTPPGGRIGRLRLVLRGGGLVVVSGVRVVMEIDSKEGNG